jgi:hypothetical protein
MTISIIPPVAKSRSTEWSTTEVVMSIAVAYISTLFFCIIIVESVPPTLDTLILLMDIPSSTEVTTDAGKESGGSVTGSFDPVGSATKVIIATINLN